MSAQEPPRHVVHSRFYARTFGLVTAVAVGYLLFRIIQPFLSQLIWAGLLAAILYPLHTRLTIGLRNRPTASSALIAFGGALLILVPAALLGTVFSRQAGQLLNRIQAAAEQRHIEGLSDILALPVVKSLLDQLHDWVGLQPEQVIDWATTGAERGIQFLLQASGNLFVGALGVVGNFLFVVFFLFFFLRDGANAVATVAHLIPMPMVRRSELFETLSNTAQAVVLGTLLTAAVQGTLVGVGFAMAGLPSAIVFGVLAMLCSPIPMVGTALIWLPGAAALFLQGRVGWGIFMVAWGVLVVSMVDNILRPLLISGRSGVPTLLVFAGVLGGLSAFGMVGMFIGPLILTLLVALIRYADELVSERESVPAVAEGHLSAAPAAPTGPSPANPPQAASESPSPSTPTASGAASAPASGPASQPSAPPQPLSAK